MIYIRKGRYLITGQYVPNGWTIHVPGGDNRTISRRIGDAKRIAVELGASGKWRREVRNVGVRGAGIVHYFDAEAPQ